MSVVEREGRWIGGKGEEGMNEYESRVVRLTLWGEARGEPVHGIVAVASVIFNRAAWRMSRLDTEHDSMSGFLAGECLRPAQFSCWSDGKFIQQYPESQIATDLEAYKWRVCGDVADTMVSGAFEPLVPATHYYAMSIEKAPEWAEGMDFVGRFGNQFFWQDRGMKI